MSQLMTRSFFISCFAMFSFCAQAHNPFKPGNQPTMGACYIRVQYIAAPDIDCIEDCMQTYCYDNKTWDDCKNIAKHGKFGWGVLSVNIIGLDLGKACKEI